MKIGIITLPFNNNYGGFLQAYALMTILKRMGHDVWFIDLQNKPYYHSNNIFSIHLDFLKILIKKYILRRNISSWIPKKYSRNEDIKRIITWQNTQPFVDKYLCPKISPIYSSKELTYLIDKFHFDAFISGSDQIWRPKYMGHFLKTTYFDFLKDRKEKRISYAASFGVDEWEYTLKQTKECTKLIKKFSAVSVREESGVTLCKEYLGVDAQWVVDPTILLNKEDYIHLIEEAKIKQNAGDLFCYILDEADEKHELVESVAKQLNLMPFDMGLKKHHKKRECQILESVETWLRGFYDAKFVITDSFHGMVFSIVFNVPFLCLVNEQRGGSRFTSLAKQFGLENRLIFSRKDFLVEEINKNIDWAFIDEQKAIKRNTSLNFLKSHI
jgi:hypothetical protein